MRRQTSRRTYDASSRQEAADQTRAHILDEARRRFLADGYAATTISRIASAAGVSQETIYKAFGGKPGLVRAIAARALAGSGRVHAEQRSDEMQARVDNAHVLFRGWSKLVVEVAPRIAPIMLLVRDAAAHDADAAALQRELDRQRLARMTKNARSLRRFGIATSHARDVMWTATSAELYELLVMKRGWSVKRFSEFVYALFVGTLPTTEVARDGIKS